MARQALFPETVLDGPPLDTRSLSAADDINDTEMGGEFSSLSDGMEMNELLENLAGWNNDSFDTNASSDDDTTNNDETASSLSYGEGETDQLGEELQEWRRAHADSPYESWSDERKQSLMVRFVSSRILLCCITDSRQTRKVETEGHPQSSLPDSPHKSIPTHHLTLSLKY